MCNDMGFVNTGKSLHKVASKTDTENGIGMTKAVFHYVKYSRKQTTMVLVKAES